MVQKFSLAFTKKGLFQVKVLLLNFRHQTACFLVGINLCNLLLQNVNNNLRMILNFIPRTKIQISSIKFQETSSKSQIQSIHLARHVTRYQASKSIFQYQVSFQHSATQILFLSFTNKNSPLARAEFEYLIPKSVTARLRSGRRINQRGWQFPFRWFLLTLFFRSPYTLFLAWHKHCWHPERGAVQQF